MPTYEYACKSCGSNLEVVQAFSDDALTECPACGGELRKVFGSIGISFKGSGFYKNDSRSTTTSKKNADSTSTSTSESKTDSSEKKSDSSPSPSPAKTSDVKAS